MVVCKYENGYYCNGDEGYCDIYCDTDFQPDKRTYYPNIDFNEFPDNGENIYKGREILLANEYPIDNMGLNIL